MGVGNNGEFLSDYEDGNTYLTRDGGKTWKMVRRGPHLYEFGDHGALVVIVNDKDETDHIRFSSISLLKLTLRLSTRFSHLDRYSWDEGNTWEQFKFSDTKIRVHSLTTFPDSTSQKFLISGEEEDEDENDEDESNQNKFVVIQIDFSDLHVQQCNRPTTRIHVQYNPLSTSILNQS